VYKIKQATKKRVTYYSAIYSNQHSTPADNLVKTNLLAEM